MKRQVEKIRQFLCDQMIDFGRPSHICTCVHACCKTYIYRRLGENKDKRNYWKNRRAEAYSRLPLNDKTFAM